jgi:hypothetical protein
VRPSCETWAGLSFEPVTWHDPRGWLVSNAPPTKEYPTRYVATWRTRGEHPDVVGVGAMPEAAVLDCVRQMRATLAIVTDEIRARVGWRDALTEALAEVGNDRTAVAS